MTQNNSNRPAPKPKAKRFLHGFLVPRFIANEVATWRELGLGGYIRKRGFRFLAAVFLFYLVRDGMLYVVIPYLVVSGLIGCPGPEAGP